MARLDAWLWSVRLFKTRSAATAACRGGHVRVNDAPAKAAQPVATGVLLGNTSALTEYRKAVIFQAASMGGGWAGV